MLAEGSPLEDFVDSPAFSLPLDVDAPPAPSSVAVELAIGRASDLAPCWSDSLLNAVFESVLAGTLCTTEAGCVMLAAWATAIGVITETAPNDAAATVARALVGTVTPPPSPALTCAAALGMNAMNGISAIHAPRPNAQ
jgi:hypothetical protein